VVFLTRDKAQRCGIHAVAQSDASDPSFTRQNPDTAPATPIFSPESTTVRAVGPPPSPRALPPNPPFPVLRHLVLVHSYFSASNHFCTRSSIVHTPRSRLHFPFSQEVSL
jgi:hypothetical protein